MMAQTIYPDQPPPVHGPDSVPVWPVAIAIAKRRMCRPETIAAMEERQRVGLERYGVELSTNNTRNPKIDLLQELLDAVAYSQQWLMESDCPSEQGLADGICAELTRLIGLLV